LLLTMGLLPLQAEILYESDWATGNIYKFTSDGVRSTFASGLNAPEGLAFDGAGNLYVGNAGASQIVKITPDGTKSVFAGGFLNPFGLAFNSTGDLFVSTDNGNIYQVAPDGSVSTFASGFNQPHGIAFDSTGNLFVADAGHYQIVKVAPNGQKGAFASSLFNDPKGLVFNRLDELFMSNYGGITKYEPNGTSSPVSSAAALGLGMTFDHSGNLFVADFSSNKISKSVRTGARLLSRLMYLNLLVWRLSSPNLRSPAWRRCLVFYISQSRSGATVRASANAKLEKLIGGGLGHL